MGKYQGVEQNIRVGCAQIDTDDFGRLHKTSWLNDGMCLHETQIHIEFDN